MNIKLDNILNEEICNQLQIERKINNDIIAIIFGNLNCNATQLERTDDQYVNETRYITQTNYCYYYFISPPDHTLNQLFTFGFCFSHSVCNTAFSITN